MTSLAYINDTMNGAVIEQLRSPTLDDTDRAEIATKGRKLIGGFRVHDGAAEKKALDDLIEARRKTFVQFRKDRAALYKSLKALGVTALAYCPTGAWYSICKEANLIVLSPDKDGRVGIDSKWADGVKNAAATDTWPVKDLLRKMFPDGVSLSSSTHRATIILPDPPADVAETLVKAQSLKLTTAAVPEAIRFVEKPSDLVKANAHPKDAWAQAQGYEDYQDWLKRDPIVFTEHGTATAVIAQFGDFPIEKQVVDAAVSVKTLLSKKPTTDDSISMIQWSSADAMTATMMRQIMEQEHRAMMGTYGGLRRGLFG